MQIELDDYMGMIKSRAAAFSWLIAQDRALTFDDLVGEGLDIFLTTKKMHETNPGITEFSTKLHRRLTQRYMTMGERRKAQKRDAILVYTDPDPLIEPVPDQKIEAINTWHSLTEEAQSVIRIIIDSPQELLDMGKITKDRLVVYLTRRKGWDRQKAIRFIDNPQKYAFKKIYKN